MIARKSRHALQLKHNLIDAKLTRQKQHPFCNVFGEIADPFKIIANSQRSDDLSEVNGHGLAPRDSSDRFLFDIVLLSIDEVVSRNYALAICSSPDRPMSTIFFASSCKSESNARIICSTIAIPHFQLHWNVLSAEAARNVILCSSITRCSEELGRFIEFDQLAKVQKGREVGYASCLLHIMGHDDDGVLRLQFVY